MRQHVGKHILVGNMEGQNLCGFCGRETCSNEFLKKSWKSKEAFYEIKSNCPYFVKMKKNQIKIIQDGIHVLITLFFARYVKLLLGNTIKKSIILKNTQMLKCLNLFHNQSSTSSNFLFVLSSRVLQGFYFFNFACEYVINNFFQFVAVQKNEYHHLNLKREI